MLNQPLFVCVYSDIASAGRLVGYTHTHIHTHTHIYIYTHTQRSGGTVSNLRQVLLEMNRRDAVDIIDQALSDSLQV